MNDEIKKAERLGYARGYSAGRRKVKRAARGEHRKAREDALWQRLFISLLPVAMRAEGWSFGEKPVTTSDDRVRLAKAWADRALAQAQQDGRA